MHKLLFDLQLFAEGGADGSGADGAAQDGTMQNNAGDTVQDAAAQTGEGQEEAQQEQDAAAKRMADYKAFKEKFKDEYDTDVQNILKRRMKSAQKAQQEADAYHEKAERIMRILKVKHGTEDLDALVEAVEADDGYFEDEAIRRGMDVGALRSMQETAWENAQLKAQQEQTAQEQAMEKQVQTWQQWEQEAKAVYPAFDLETEMNNPQFAQLANAGVDFKTAYQVAHINDSLTGAMQYGAQETQRRMAQVTQQNAKRPDENTLQSGKAMKPKIDFSNMSDDKFNQMLKDVKSGKRIVL